MSEEKTIGGGTAFMMLFVAIVVDGLQALLTLLVVGIVVNPFISVITGILFWIWFYHLGVKMGIGLAATGVAELTILGSFPLWAGYVISRIALAKFKKVVGNVTGA